MDIVTNPQTVLADLLARLHGPGALRFIVQPLVAVLLGVRDGLADARAGRPLYLWGLFFDASERRAMRRHGAMAILKPFVIAIVVDAVLSFLTQGAVYPGQTLLVGICLVALPDTLARSTTNRLVRYRHSLRPAPGIGSDARLG